MCERFSMVATTQTLIQSYGIDVTIADPECRSYFSPVETVSVILTKNQKRRLDRFRWGLMPFWAVDSRQADSRSIFRKQAFDRIVRKQRCIVPSDGFYGWMEEGKKRIPVRIENEDRSLFGMAGIYEVWRSASGKELKLCSVLTKEANAIVSPYHERMPVILNQEAIDVWLDESETDKRLLQDVLMRPDEWRLYAHPMDVVAEDENKTRMKFGYAK